MELLRQAASIVLAVSVTMMLHGAASAAPKYRTLGQPDLASISLDSRCADPNARFSFSNAGGFEQHGPSGIAIDPGGRLFVTDYAGNRVLTWPDFETLASCQPADAVIGAGELTGPEAIAIDAKTGDVFVANTLDHTVIGYRKPVATWSKFVTLGTPGVSGTSNQSFNFPRGLAVDSGGRLFVADDFNNRVQIFDPPFTTGEDAVDGIAAGANAGFNSPKGLAMTGNTLFVADFNNNRVLRFTGPFRTPDQVYVASGIFTGVVRPVDVAIHPDGALLVTEQKRQRIARFSDAAWTYNLVSPAKTFAANIGPEPLGVAADRDGRIYIADYQHYRILIRDDPASTKPVSANSSRAAKSLLSDLRQRPGRKVNRVVIGQQLITWKYGRKSNPKGWYGDWLQLAQAGYPLPEVMGGELSDLMTYPGFRPNKGAFDELISHGKNGHIVTLVWHPDNPVPGGGFGTPIATADLIRMVNGATSIGVNWQLQLDRAAAVLQKFEDAGVPVLFRPLHEQNGNFFWWGDKGQSGTALRERQQAWVGVWRDLVNELTVNKGLGNLVFTFGTNQVNFDGVVPPLTYYPGGQWADAVSIDIYDDELDLAGNDRGLQHYSALVGSGKPFGLAEFGQSYDESGTAPTAADWDARTLLRRINDSYPRMAFAVSWYSSVEGDPVVAYVLALPDVAFTLKLLVNKLIDTQ